MKALPILVLTIAAASAAGAVATYAWMSIHRDESRLNPPATQGEAPFFPATRDALAQEDSDAAHLPGPANGGGRIDRSYPAREGDPADTVAQSVERGTQSPAPVKGGISRAYGRIRGVAAVTTAPAIREGHGGSLTPAFRSATGTLSKPALAGASSFSPEAGSVPGALVSSSSAASRSPSSVVPVVVSTTEESSTPDPTPAPVLDQRSQDSRPPWPRGNFTPEQERYRAQVGWQNFSDWLVEEANSTGN